MADTTDKRDVTTYDGTPVVRSYIATLPNGVVEQARRIAQREGWAAVFVAGYGTGGVFVSEDDDG